MSYLRLLLIFITSCCWANDTHISGDYTWDLQGNPVGGEKQGFAQAGCLTLLATVDLDHYCHLKDTSFVISGIYRSGINLSSVYINNVMWASQIFGGETWWLCKLYLQKEFCNKRLTLQVGRLNMGELFAYSPLYDFYVNSGINDFIFNLSENVFFHDTPYATWGAYLLANLTPQHSVSLGAFNANENVAKNSSHGCNFQFTSTQGLAWFSQYTFQPPKSYLPGHYSVGTYYYTGVFGKLQGGNVRGNWGWYLMADQTIYKIDDDRKITPFVNFCYAPIAYNQMPYFTCAGIVFEGPFAQRPKDFGAIGFGYGSFSSALRAVQRMGISPEFGNLPQNFEAMIEITYAFQVNKCFVLQPDIQYIIEPNGYKDIENALVLGVQLDATF
ncbi:MAG: carbohydrate porin [Chlamydiales bacterium]|nr:carbohydrate porin [Chlamydiia bacterium]MCP5507451.1 carbohydrate porin [Chlamydiales bacterium]